MSWGSNEFNGETSYDSYFNHAGVSYVASAGDTGGVAEWPAEAPDVVSVGGTYITTDTTSGARYSESAWGTSAANVGGSGGGVSAYEPKPFYQGGVTLSSSRRTSPDVSYNADPNSGFYVYDGNYNGQAGWFNVGGTSAGAAMGGTDRHCRPALRQRRKESLRHRQQQCEQFAQHDLSRPEQNQHALQHIFRSV